MAVDVSCLYSVVKNVSGRTQKFPFLPPHGRELAANAQVSIPGDIRQEVMTRTPGRSNKRRFDALTRALGNNATNDRTLQIISTPAAVVYDETDAVSVILTADNGVVVINNPCWEQSAS